MINTLPDSNSLLSIKLYQNYLKSFSSPLIEQKIFNVNDTYMMADISGIFCENGRFQKLFKESSVIGSGGFGTVYQAINIIENRHYAIKKIKL